MKDREKNKFFNALMKNQAIINSGAISAYRTDIVKEELSAITNEDNDKHEHKRF